MSLVLEPGWLLSWICFSLVNVACALFIHMGKSWLLLPHGASCVCKIKGDFLICSFRPNPNTPLAPST